MIEIIVWVVTQFLAGIAMLLTKEHAASISGLSYISVGLAALLGLYLNLDSPLLASLLIFFDSWWILETFIFMNIITGYSLYARFRRNS